MTQQNLKIFQLHAFAKNLERLVRWEMEDPGNKRYKFPGFENMEHYDRPWVVDEIVDNVGEVDLQRCAETASRLQRAREARGDYLS